MTNKKRISAWVKTFAAGSAVALGLSASSAFADVTISNGVTYLVDNSNTTSNNVNERVWNESNLLTMFNGAILQVQPNQKPPGIYLNAPLILAGGAGTVTMRFNNNDADYLWTNSISSVATGAQTLALFTGYNNNGDRASLTFNSGIPDGSGLSLSVTFATQTAPQSSWVNLRGTNTFTGPIALLKGATLGAGYLTIGGQLTRYNGNTIGSGSLNNGNYAGAISLGTSTIFNYASTAPQTLAGPISGVGAVQVTGSGPLTLTATNTYTGNTTVSSGCSLVLATNATLKYLVTDSSNNVVTGTGAATFNGTFTIDSSAVTVSSNSWTLVNLTSKTFGPNFGLAGFTGPVGNLYSATIGNRAYTFNKSNGVLQVSSPAQISSFGIPTYPGTINQSNKTIALTIPDNIPLATLAPTYTLTSGTCSQTSGAPPSPTFAVQNPATYTVVDGTFTNNYVVTITVVDLTSRLYFAPFYVLTTTNGANLPTSAVETNFPILLRLNASNFNFSQARTNGADILFTTATSNSLPYEIEQWDAANGTASIWVQVPNIRGNTNQQLLMFWGNTNATSQSSGPAVFNSANGYSCVLHMNGIADSTGTLSPVNVGTTATNGVAGPARHFVAGQGINAQNITSFPSGNAPHTTEAWFRPIASGSDIMGWGVSTQQGKTVIQLRSPPQINVDCWFSAGNVSGASSIAISQWHHVAHVYTNGQVRLYIDGVLDGSGSGGSAMTIPNPAKLYVGGWWDTYGFAGIIDEVRIASVTRSSNWMWLQYQNQNPLQTLVGHLVQPGNTFSISTTNVTLNEGTITNLTAQAGGAVKLSWLLKQNSQQTVIAVDQFALALAAGQVTSNQSYVIQFKAVYADGSVQTNDIAVNVLDTIPDPGFTLATSTNLWDGRATMTVTPVIFNLAALQAAGATNLTYTWNVAGVAVIKTNPAPGTLTLLRSQGSGPMTVTLVLNNGGALITNSVTVPVQEPVSDVWVVRTPAANEVPTNGQFYARDDAGFGTIYCNGTVSSSPNSVFLEVYTNGPGGDVLYTNISAAPSGTNFALVARIPAGLITYSVNWGKVTGSTTNILGTAGNIVCGDAYILDGQSNTVTSDVPDDASTNQWVRSYGKSGAGWGSGVPHGGNWSLGYWGWALATNIVANHGIPVCVINGAVGGTRIDQHQANPTNHFAPYGPFGYTIYANLLTRVAGAKLTHGIRGFLWHQGEQDQGAVGPDGDYNYKFHQQYFVDMSAAWKQDCPNLRYYYIFQIWPAACGDTSANDMLREVQRTLPRLYSNMRVMSTLGIVPGGSCHYSVAGYLQFFNLMGPLVRQDNYGFVPTNDITAPDLQQAYFTTTNRNEIALVFGQNVAWTNNAATNLFYLDYVSPAAPGMAGKVASGSASNNMIKLQLNGPSTNKTITYVVGGTWGSDQSRLIKGSNGIAALTFCAVPIADPVVAVATPPVINSLLPTSGLTNGGTVVTLSGSNFLSGTSVQFGAGSATAITVNGPTQITATTPANAPGAVSVVVLNTNGLAVTNLNAFTYVLPPPPATLSSFGQAGGNLVMVWAGGTNQSCVLLSSTNVTQPLSAWTAVATNAVGPGGLSTNSVPIGPGEPRRFYRFSIPYN